MNAPIRAIVVIVLVTWCVGAVKLPSYITPCARDSTLSDCATAEAKKVVPKLIDGDKSLKIPPLNPLKLEGVNINAGEDLKIDLKEVVINGFEDHVIDRVDIDLEKRHITVKLQFARLNLIAEYTISGHILVLPITGNGPANITFVGGKYVYTSDFVLVKRGNEEYMSLKNPNLTYTTTRSYFHLDNLFGGDKVVGDQTNQVLNSDWREVEKLLGPSIAEVISTIVTEIFNKMFDTYPLNDLFIGA